jgi:nitrite reductase (NO-forming)
VISATRSSRATWHRRSNAVVLLYACAALAVGAYQRAWPPDWLLVHLLLLGAVTNAIVIWTAHFTTTLLPGQPGASPKIAPVSLAVLNAGVVTALTGGERDSAPVAVAGAALVVLVVAWHGAAMAAAGRRAGRARFGPVVRFYCAAAAALLAGVSCGAALEVGVSSEWYSRLYAAHVELNIFGWIALTVLGTQAALWPMVLRTRMLAGAETALRHALPLCVGGLAVTVGGLLAGNRVVAVIGVCGYLLGASRTLEPFARTAMRRRPHSLAAFTLAAAVCWFLAGLAADLGKLVAAGNMAEFAGAVGNFVPWLMAGFVVQVLIGALTYLLPVVLGGGPTGGRRTSGLLDRYGVARLMVFNAGVLLVAVWSGGVVADIGWALVGLAVLAFCLLAGLALRMKH